MGFRALMSRVASHAGSLAGTQITETTANSWACDLRRGLLCRDFRPTYPSSVFRNELPDNTRSTKLDPDALENIGIPAPSEIPLNPAFLANHPLKSLITKNGLLNSADLNSILNVDSDALDLRIIGRHPGVVTASISDQILGRVAESEAYSNNLWLRDAILCVVALHEGEFHAEANGILKNIWHQLGASEQRWHITQFHFGAHNERTRAYLDLNSGPPIKLSVGDDGVLYRYDDWGHHQLDALGAAVWAPYKFANRQERKMGAHTFDIRDLEPVGGIKDGVLPAMIKMLYGIKANATSDRGPWEDFLAESRATSVGVVVAALNEAKIFHDRAGWDYFPVEYAGRQDGYLFEQQLSELLRASTETLYSRIPENGFAVECDRRPYDSSMLLALAPFDSHLSLGRQNSILKTVYKNIGEAGIRRWEFDLLTGLRDDYVGQDYHYNANPEKKGEFADNTVADYRPAEWTLFDPILAIYYYKRYMRSQGTDTKALEYADRHLKRSMSFITTEDMNLFVAGKQRNYHIPKGILPEAFVWDSKKQAWLPNHNSPLLMAQAVFGLSFRAALKAMKMAEEFHWALAA